jgi:hypothetical protein
VPRRRNRSSLLLKKVLEKLYTPKVDTEDYDKVFTKVENPQNSLVARMHGADILKEASNILKLPRKMVSRVW